MICPWLKMTSMQPRSSSRLPLPQMVIHVRLTNEIDRKTRFGGIIGYASLHNQWFHKSDSSVDLSLVSWISMTIWRNAIISESSTPFSSFACGLEPDSLPVFVPVLVLDVALFEVFLNIISHTFSPRLFDSSVWTSPWGHFWNSKNFPLFLLLKSC